MDSVNVIQNLPFVRHMSYCRTLFAYAYTVNDFFGKIGAIYGRLNHIAKPIQFYNCDETGVSIAHRLGKFAAEMGCRNVYAITITSAEKGKSHTILSCVSASGYVLPPMMVYQCKQSLPEKFIERAIANTL